MKKFKPLQFSICIIVLGLIGVTLTELGKILGN